MMDGRIQTASADASDPVIPVTGQAAGGPADASEPVIVIAGPTASGKSSTALRVALALNGEIVSADSMQIYRGMDIGTAKVSPAERALVPHHLIDILPPEATFSVAAWQQAALAAIADIRARGRRAIVCGGTGQYISALMDGIAFTPIADDPELRAALSARADREGTATLLAEIAAFDPETAARLHEKDRKRIIRAHEIHRLTGFGPTELNARSRQQPLPYRYIGFCLWPERALLYERIEHRVDAMLAEGLVEEVRRLGLQGLPPDAPCRQAIGYKEVFDHLAGSATLAETAERIKLATRHYAKRQLTWFRRMDALVRVETADPDAAFACIMERLANG